MTAKEQGLLGMVDEMLSAYDSVPCTWGRIHDHAEITAARQDLAALASDTGERGVGVAEGFALVPKHIYVSPEAWEAASFAFGGQENADEDDNGFLPCTLWVGEIEGDDGNKTHGLHVSCDECPEEGSITLSEFAPAAIRAQPQPAGIGWECFACKRLQSAVPFGCEECGGVIGTLKTIPPESGGQGEAVAWEYEDEDGWVRVTSRHGVASAEGHTNIRHLYTQHQAQASGAVTEAMVEVVPVVVSDAPDAHRVQFVVGTQQFHIGPDYFDTRAETEFFAGMFRQALAQGAGNER